MKSSGLPAVASSRQIGKLACRASRTSCPCTRSKRCQRMDTPFCSAAVDRRSVKPGAPYTTWPMKLRIEGPREPKLPKHEARFDDRPCPLVQVSFSRSNFGRFLRGKFPVGRRNQALSSPLQLSFQECFKAGLDLRIFFGRESICELLTFDRE